MLSPHPSLELSNVKFMLLPPNTTSKLQPMDAGIMQTVKLLYRKQFLRQVLFELDKDETETAPDVAKSVDLLDAMLWVKRAWRDVKPSTIKRCFAKCGFVFDEG